MKSGPSSPTEYPAAAERRLSAPSLLWMLCFFVGPAVFLFSTAFRPATSLGGIGGGWTLESWGLLHDAAVLKALWRTIWICLLTVGGCVMLAVPVAWRITRMPDRWRQRCLILLVLPFWTSFLVRVYSWRVLLQSQGPLSQWLVSAGVMSPDGSLLYNQGAVLLVMIYTYLPLAILPVCSAMEKFDMNLFEAARDLGASRSAAFFRVVLPNTARGITAAALIVGIPSLGSYVVPEMVGGQDSEMIGTKIAHKLFADRHLPQAAVLASLLAACALPAIMLALRNKETKTR